MAVVAELLRHGCRPEHGALLAAMLASASVELVLALHARGRLSLLVRTAFRAPPDGLAWRAVRAGLVHQWPGKVAEVLNRADLAPDEASTTHTCPITLVECVRPVVASDGHTYERDALMRHFACNGLVSPLTKEVLEPWLFDNRAI